MYTFGDFLVGAACDACNLSVAEQENCLFMLAAFLRKLLLEARKYEGQVQHTLLGEASPALLTHLCSVGQLREKTSLFSLFSLLLAFGDVLK